MDKLEFIRTELAALRASGLYGIMRTVESSQGAWITLNGHRVLIYVLTVSRTLEFPKSKTRRPERTWGSTGLEPQQRGSSQGHISCMSSLSKP